MVNWLNPDIIVYKFYKKEAVWFETASFLFVIPVKLFIIKG